MNEINDVLRIVGKLASVSLEISTKGASAIYKLEKLPDPGQTAPLIVFYLATKQDRAANMSEKLLLKFPCLEDLTGLEAQRERVERVTKALNRQRNIMRRLERVASVPALFQASKVSAENVDLKKYCLIREYIDGVSLDAWMERYAEKQGWDRFQGIQRVDDWFEFAGQLVKALEKIHRMRVLHGDLRPENIIVQGDGDGNVPSRIFLINAEEQTVNTRILRDVPDAGTFRRKYDAPIKLFTKSDVTSAAALRNPKANWYAPADIFALGATLFELACGRHEVLHPFHFEQPVQNHPDWYIVKGYETLRTDQQLKEFVLKALKERNEELAFVDSKGNKDPASILRIAEVVMGCVRSQTRTQVVDIQGVQEILEQFASPMSSAAEQEGKRPQIQARRRVADLLVKCGELPRPLEAVVNRRLDILTRDLNHLAEHSLLGVSGGREELVDGLLTMLGELREGDNCRALTTPKFFFPGNVGPFGRVTTALQLARARGANLCWILVVNETNLRDRDITDVLDRQKQAAKDLDDLKLERMKDQDYGAKYAVLPSREYQSILHRKLSFIELKPKHAGKPLLLIAPDYRGEEEELSVLRLWSIPAYPRTEDYKKDYYKYFEEIQEFKRLELISSPIQSFHR